jgi:ribonuclease BN (tRNA processing enzyme)
MAPLTLTILGASPAAPNPGGANAAYLVRGADTAVVVDCGPGSAGRIALHVPVNTLDGVVISHFHPDHYFDLVALYYLLKFGAARPAGYPPRVPLWVPPDGREFLDRFGMVVGQRSSMFDDVFDLEEYAVYRPTRIGNLMFAFHPVQHYVPSHAMRIQSDGQSTLVYSADVAPCAALIEAARNAALFLCEASLHDASQDEHDPTRRGHMNAREAGEIARKAGARRLVITHYRSSETEDVHHLSEAAKAYQGRIELAREGQTYTLD